MNDEVDDSKNRSQEKGNEEENNEDLEELAEEKEQNLLNKELLLNAKQQEPATINDVTNTHFNIVDKDNDLRGHKRIATIDALNVGMWVLVSYDSEIYIGQVMKIHPNAPEIGDGARIKCLERRYGDMDPKNPQDFEPMIHWILHPIKNLYECPVRVREVMRKRKVLWSYTLE